MKDWYFYQDNGKTVGPVGLEALRARIQDGTLRVFDLIFQDGDEQWRMALDHSRLRGEFQAGTLSSLRERPWVCLRRKTEGEMDFVTSGPFTADEIRASLKSGEFSYSDYAWKDGLSGWFRLGALEEFNSRLKKKENLNQQLPIPEDSGPDLIKNVIEMRRPQVPDVEPPPIEASGPDLAQSGYEATVIARVSPSPPSPAVGEDEPLEATVVAAPSPLLKKKQRPRSRVDWSLVGLFVVLAVGIYWMVWQVALPRYRAQMGAPEPSVVESPPPAESPREVPDVVESKVNEVAVAPVEVPTSPAPVKPTPTVTKVEPPVSKEPKELFLNVQMVNANQARIEIRTNGTPDFPVYVQVVGIPGQIADGGSFYRFAKYKPSGDSTQPLDLSNLKIPQGRFILRAETGGLKRETRLNMGVNDPGFKPAILRQRKMWAHAIWKERLVLFKLSQQLEKQLTEAMIPTKKFSSKGLESLVGFKRSNGAQYFMFESWWELHQITKAAKSGMSAELLARAKKERDRLAAFSVWK